MADKATQGQEDTLWWELDALPGPSALGASFDEPLVWPESLVWDDLPGTGAGAGEPLLLPDAPPVDLDVADLFWPDAEPASAAAAPEPPAAPASDLGVNWNSADDEVTAYHVEPLAALGGGASAAAAARPRATGDRLPESIWTEAPGAKHSDGLLVSSTPAPTGAFYAATDGGGRGARHRRFAVRPGNAGVIALISLASLVLLGMFLSVRARNDVPTDTSQTRLPPGDGISVTSPLNTVPLTTTVTTAAPNAIDIGALLPPPEDTAPTTASGSGTGTGAPATTAAPRATAAPTGGTGSTGTTAPATQTTTATTTPPPTTAATSPPTTAAPQVEDTQPPTTRRPTTSTSFTFPSIPGTSVPTNGTGPSFTFPSITFP